MKSAALTLMKHRKEVMNDFHDRIANAICEGIIFMIQAAKRKTSGFNTFEGVKLMVFLAGGKLKLYVPSLF